MKTPERANKILNFWFGDLAHTSEYFDHRMKLWFMGGYAVDQKIRQEFGEDLEKALRGVYQNWEETPKGALALIILLDQFSLNLFREQPRSYQQSARAIPISRRLIKRGFDWALSPAEKAFVYLPFEHSEKLADQIFSVSLFKKLAKSAPRNFAPAMMGFLDYAQRHHKVVKKFGRFPDRNEVFGRKNSKLELLFLASDQAPF